MSPSAAPILLVDDDELVRRALRLSLRGLGHPDVVEAASGEAGLEELGRRDFAFALVDLRMPGMGGHAAIRKAAELCPRVPLVGMSAHSDMNDVIDCLRDGAVDFLVKPWTRTELGDLVRRTLNKGGARVEAAPLAPITPPSEADSWTLIDDEAFPLPDTFVAGRPTVASVIARLDTGEIALPAQPTVALIVRRLLTRGDGSADQVKAIIERDSHLTGRIMRIANSPVFAGVGRVKDLRAAVARIGNREIGGVVETLIARQFYEVTIPAARAHVEAQWRKAWARAVCMRMLAQHLGSKVPPESAYLTGLFCDAGAAFLLRELAVLLGAAPDATDFADIAASHAEVSAIIAAAWDLPDEVVDACRSHHDLGPASLREPLVCLAAAAELLCAGLELPPEVAPIEIPGDLLEHLGLSPAQLPDLRDRAAELLRRGAEMLATEAAV